MVGVDTIVSDMQDYLNPILFKYCKPYLIVHHSLSKIYFTKRFDEHY